MPNNPTLSDRLKNVDVRSELSQFSFFMDSCTSSSSRSQASATRTRLPRKPRKGNEIIPSIYRPHVVASDRLLKWTSPHTQKFRENMAKALPESHLTRLFEVMAFSLDQAMQ